MPYNWDDANQKHLLLAVIHLTMPGPPKWDQVAKMLGDGCTSEGARKQFAKLKNSAKDTLGEAGEADEEGDSKPKTPAKGRAKKTTGETSKKSASKRKADKADGGAADDDVEESPLKKIKAEATKGEDDEE
ncbi:hypothetical protein Slin15195_G048860 [Septoria linicola]|uniref:Myb-like domain-containing protein n=1 Tax=Septoria linicola TaxID=215465 RepID=A0A9Q9AT72_9PEZI|nr:hypothetical protein Slin14017_G052420 [Septoria linicola]USW51567.1 hypothetical protein Slin15195_G048860 [Septoria linicola]